MNIDDYINEHFDEITEGVEPSVVTKFVKQLRRFYIELEKENSSSDFSREEGERYETDFATIGEVNQALSSNIEAINEAIIENYNKCQGQIGTLTDITKLQRDLIKGVQEQVSLLTNAVMNLTKGLESPITPNKTN